MTDTQPILVRPRWDSTPPVDAGQLGRALLLMRANPEGAAEAMGKRWTRPRALALFARAKALLVWTCSPAIQEYDRLLFGQWDLEQEIGIEIDAQWEKQLEALARVLAASKHPLDGAGRLAQGFRQSIAEARKALVRERERTN
jgi:hypothetical protein